MRRRGHWLSWTVSSKVELVVEDVAESTTPKSSPDREQSFEVSSWLNVAARPPKKLWRTKQGPFSVSHVYLSDYLTFY